MAFHVAHHSGPSIALPADAQPFVPIYRDAAKVFSVSPYLLMAVHEDETQYSTCTAPGCPSQHGTTNGAGAAGAMQFLTTTWPAYANAYKGGLDGHKINLVTCQNQETPAGGQACANQLVQDKVVAVVLPFTGQGATEVPTITKAGIPYITLSGASNQELMTPGAYDLTGGYPATLAAYAQSAKAHGYSKFAMLVSNVPAAIQGAELLGSLVFKNAGVGYKVIPVNPGTADVTPQLQAAVSWGAKAIGLTGDVTLCSSFLKGYQTLGLTEPKYVISTCLDPSIFSTLGSVLGGSYIDTTSNASSAEPRCSSTSIGRAPSRKPLPAVIQSMTTAGCQVCTASAMTWSRSRSFAATSGLGTSCPDFHRDGWLGETPRVFASLLTPPTVSMRNCARSADRQVGRGLPGAGFLRGVGVAAAVLIPRVYPTITLRATISMGNVTFSGSSYRRELPWNAYARAGGR